MNDRQEITIKIVVSRVIYADERNCTEETFSWMAIHIHTEVKISTERSVNNHELNTRIITVRLSILELNTVIKPFSQLINKQLK